MIKPSTALLTVLVAVAGSGCFWTTTKHEGKMMRQDIDRLEKRVEIKEDNLKTKITKLEEVLEEATKVLKRNSADLGADFESLSADVRTMQGLVTEAQRYANEVRQEAAQLKDSITNDREVLAKRLESMEQRLAALEQQASQPTAEKASELWDQGKAAFDSREYDKARTLFKKLVLRFPGHDRADDGQYYMGESYFLEQDHDGAIRELQKVFDKFDQSALADDALFRAGEAAQILRRCSEARAYFGLLRQKYPRSPLVKKSKDKDQELKRDAKNKKKCAS